MTIDKLPKLPVVFLFAFLFVGPIKATPKPHAIPGGIAIIDLPSETTQHPIAKYHGHRVMVKKNKASNWQAYVGIPLKKKPGSDFITLGKQKLAFEIKPHHYKTEHLTIKIKKVKGKKAKKALLQRIIRERKHMNQLLATYSIREPNLVMGLPAKGRFSSPFGLRRYQNGKPRSPHKGLDIAAPRGTLVRAPSQAKVIGTGNFLFTGKTVFLDHGLGVISFYCHLDKMLVKKGQWVKRGQRIGRIGMTGRTTGPHLHWGVSMNNARVNPLLFAS